MNRSTLNFSLLVLIQFFTMNAWCQDFFVYHITGKANYSDMSKKNEPVFYNYKILPSTVFKLEDKSALILRDKSYNLLYIKEKGSYSAANLTELFKNKGKNSNFAKTTIEFLSSELVRSNEDIRTYADSHLKRTGGVSRGESCVQPLMLQPVGGQLLYDSVFYFKWKKSPTSTSYEFRITDGSTNPSSEQTLYYAVVNDASELSINIDSLDFLTEDGNYAWIVNPVKEPNCVRFNFKITSKKEIKTLKDSLIQVTDTAQNLTDQLVELANLYEINGLIQEAVDCCELAYTLTENQAFLTLSKLIVARHRW